MQLAARLVPVLFLAVASACARGPASRGAADLYAGQTPPGAVPEVFAPGLVSTDGNQSGVVIYPGGREIYFFTVENRGGRVHATIMVTRLVNGSWTRPEPASFSGTYLDGYPAVHPDGSRLYFQSNRPIDPSESTFEYNLWYVERRGDGWSEARSLGRPINGRHDTSGPSVTSDGTLFFCELDMESGASEILRSRELNGAYQEPELLPDAINAPFQTCDSYVAPDGSFLVFPAFQRRGHQDNPGGLFVSFQDSAGEWAAARDVRPVLQSQIGGYATLSPDGRYLFFTRHEDGPRDVDVYWVSTGVLRAPATGAAR